MSPNPLSIGWELDIYNGQSHILQLSKGIAPIILLPYCFSNTRKLCEQEIQQPLDSKGLEKNDFNLNKLAI